MATRYIGVDLGGTTITAGRVDGESLADVNSMPVSGERPAEEIVDTIARAIDDAGGGHDIAAIGIGVPVPVGPESDRLIMSVNLPTLEAYPLRSALESRLGITVVLENDARCMALGEYRYGALSGCRSCACLTLGTGLGCGIVLDGEPLRGAHMNAGEIWNAPDPDGHVIEDHVSRKGLIDLYRSLSGDELEPHGMYERYLDGDRHAVKAFEMYGAHVGRAVVYVISMIDPEKIAIGGGIARSIEAFRGSMNRVVSNAWGERALERIVPAELSDRAAVLGAAATAERTVRVN